MITGFMEHMVSRKFNLIDGFGIGFYGHQIIQDNYLNAGLIMIGAIFVSAIAEKAFTKEEK